ncbi:PDZ domain-containing protein [Paenibacillus lautus]
MVIVEVQRNSPAFEAGVRPYDVIIKFNGEKVSNSSSN